MGLLGQLRRQRSLRLPAFQFGHQRPVVIGGIEQLLHQARGILSMQKIQQRLPFGRSRSLAFGGRRTSRYIFNSI
jgi:hypothetical protein